MFEFLMGVMIMCGLIALVYALMYSFGFLVFAAGMAVTAVHDWIARGDAH